VSAVITAKNNGTDWDGDGSPADPYVVLNCPPVSAPIATETPYVQDDATPAWSSGGCATKASALLSGQFAFQLFDDDLASDDTITGPLAYQFTDADLSSGGVQLSGTEALTSITFQLTKQ